MAPTPSLRVVKTLPYRGGSKQFSNRYHFDGGSPSDAAHWTALSDAIVLAEKTIYTSVLQIISAVGYDAGSEIPVWSKTYATNGTFAGGNAVRAPGDCAGLVKFTTTQRSTKNHPIYLANYFHGVCFDSTADPDNVHGGQVTAYNAYATAWITGFSDGAVNHHRAGPRGAVAQTRITDTKVRHRDFPS
jgi:hypothetical protein